MHYLSKYLPFTLTCMVLVILLRPFDAVQIYVPLSPDVAVVDTCKVEPIKSQVLILHHDKCIPMIETKYASSRLRFTYSSATAHKTKQYLGKRRRKYIKHVYGQMAP